MSIDEEIKIIYLYKVYRIGTYVVQARSTHTAALQTSACNDESDEKCSVKEHRTCNTHVG